MRIGPIRRVGIAAAAILCGVVSLQAASPSSASADPGWTRFPGAHWCATTGYDARGYQGVVCIDLDYQATGSGRQYRFTVELKCGTSAGTQRCTSAQAYFYYAMYNNATQSSETSRWDTARCVPSGPVCNPDVTVFRHSKIYPIPRGSCRNFTGVGDAGYGHGGFTLPDGYQDYAVVVNTPSIQVCGT